MASLSTRLQAFTHSGADFTSAILFCISVTIELRLASGMELDLFGEHLPGSGFVSCYFIFLLICFYELFRSASSYVEKHIAAQRLLTPILHADKSIPISKNKFISCYAIVVQSNNIRKLGHRTKTTNEETIWFLVLPVKSQENSRLERSDYKQKFIVVSTSVIYLKPELPNSLHNRIFISEEHKKQHTSNHSKQIASYKEETWQNKKQLRCKRQPTFLCRTGYLSNSDFIFK
ncbi:hypothetical protein V2J09_016716 [Rumex salicifolius]